MPSLQSPKPLEPGCLVQVVAPAGHFDRTLFFRGLGWLSQHFRVSFDRGIFSKLRTLAGSDERRATELNQAIAREDVAAIVCARGGFGCSRLLDRLDAAALQRNPKWLIGFSDITALHCFWQAQGLQSLHAHNLTGLGPTDVGERDRWLAAATHRTQPQQVPLLELYPGTASGALVGGNLAVLAASWVSTALPWPDGYVLFLEDIAEAPYRIDRMLNQLLLSGVFDRAGAIVSGQFTRCGPESELMAVLVEYAQRLRVPWLHGLAAGHERPNLPLRLGALARVHEGQLTLPP